MSTSWYTLRFISKTGKPTDKKHLNEMEEQFIEEKTFEKNNFSEHGFEKGEYELCVFSNCNFATTDLSHIRFIDCEFYDCNLSSATIVQTGFQNVLFKDCKMLGLQFDKCSDFAFSIKVDGCQLNHSSFLNGNLQKWCLKNRNFSK